jgi:hypothetical protein
MFSEEQPTCECELKGFFFFFAINLVSSFKPIIELWVHTEIFVFSGVKIKITSFDILTLVK